MKIEKNAFSIDKGWLFPHFDSLDSDKTLILFFADVMYKHHDAILTLHKHYPTSTILGCSTAGEILDNDVFNHAIVYVVIQFEKCYFKLSLCPNYTEMPFDEIGKRVAHALYQPELRHVLFFGSGLTLNVDGFMEGFLKNTGREIPISGGIAGDGEAFKSTFIYSDGFYDSGILCIGLYGEHLRTQQGCEGGWVKFGVERKITNASGNILYEIDGQPALTSYKKYLGNLSDKLPASALLFPLAIRKNQESNHVVRTILGVNEENQSIIFSGNIPKDWYACFMRCTTEGLINGAHQAYEAALTPCPKYPSVSIYISCIGRKMVLGPAIFNELQNDTSAFPSKHISIGFYSYGEIAEKAGIDSKLHNQTMTISLIEEVLHE